MTDNVHDLTQKRLEAARLEQGLHKDGSAHRAVDHLLEGNVGAAVQELISDLGLPPATPEQMAEHAEAERARHDAELARCARDRRMQALEACGIRLRRQDYAAIAESSYQTTPAVQAVRRWWDETGPGAVLCLHGAPGTGKTFAAATLVAQHGGRGARSKHLARLAKSTWSEHVAELEDLIGFDGLLVVDDVGTEPDIDAAKAALFELIDERQGADGRTILTTNLLLKDGKPGERLIDRVCARTLSRLHGCARFEGFKDQTDMRKAKR